MTILISKLVERCSRWDCVHEPVKSEGQTIYLSSRNYSQVRMGGKVN
jgi:hypothetical protein